MMDERHVGGYPAQRGRAILYLKRRGKYALDQKIHRIGSPAWRREQARIHRVYTVIPGFLLK